MAREFPGEIVLGRTKTAGCDHQVGPRPGEAERIGEGLRIVGDGRAGDDLAAALEKVACDRGRVRLLPARNQEFAAYGQKFSLHVQMTISRPRRTSCA